MGHTAYCSDFRSGPLGRVVDLTDAYTVDRHAELLAGWERLEIRAREIHSTAGTAAQATRWAAESIERQTQLDAVIRCNVGWGPGHLFSRPAPVV